jgi:hypothetical protein
MWMKNFCFNPLRRKCDTSPKSKRFGGGRVGAEKEARMKSNVMFWKQGPLLMSLLIVFNEGKRIYLKLGT